MMNKWVLVCVVCWFQDSSFLLGFSWGKTESPIAGATKDNLWIVFVPHVWVISIL